MHRRINVCSVQIGSSAFDLNGIELAVAVNTIVLIVVRPIIAIHMS